MCKLDKMRRFDGAVNCPEIRRTCTRKLLHLKFNQQLINMTSSYLHVVYGAPFVNLLFISLLVVFFVICSFIYDNFITDCPFSQRSNFTIIGYLIKPFLYLLVI